MRGCIFSSSGKLQLAANLIVRSDGIVNHNERIALARQSLDGLSVGDAFGERFFGYPDKVEWVISERAVPRAPWKYTDDTEMALAIVDVLQQHGKIEQDELAERFARRYALDPGKGYGGTAHSILTQIGGGLPWRTAAGTAFSGMGSMGNGGAMRSAPIGAYFADDLNAAIENARASAEVTHAHTEGQAGAIAIAAAAQWAVQHVGKLDADSGAELLAFAHEHTPSSETKACLAKVLTVPLDMSVISAVNLLGNGSKVISQDTVPFSLWCAARHLDNYVEAMWTTVAGLGDRDTNCAIVGGIVALSAGKKSIPDDWLDSREALVFNL